MSGAIAAKVRIVPHMAAARRRQRQQVPAQCFFVGRAVSPKRRPRFPIRSKSRVVCDRILHN